MDRLFYEVPSLARKKDAIEYIEEHYAYQSNINGCGGLDHYLSNYEEWLLKLEKDQTANPGEGRVPAKTYFLVRESDNKIIGMTNIRLALNERLRKSGGHIGYGIRPTERRKGYNKINLYLALEVCQENGIEEVMLSCYKDNPASSRTMLALGAKLIEEFVMDGKEEQNYTIQVEEALKKYESVYAPLRQKGEKTIGK